MVSITVDTRQLDRAAARVGKAGSRVVRPAVKKALTQTAARARRGEQENMRAKLDRVKQFTLNQIGYQPAKEEGTYIASRVFVRPVMSKILLRLEVGGEVRNAVIPKPAAQDRFGNLGRNGKAKILARKGTFEATIGGRLGIYRREAKTGKVKLLVGYYDKAVYTPQLGFRKKGLEFGDDFPRAAAIAFDELFAQLTA